MNRSFDFKLIGKPGIGALCAALAIAIAYGVSNTRAVVGSMPYPRHVDERNIVVAANRIISEKKLKPKFYIYSTFPVYMATAAAGLGLMVEKLRGNIASSREIRVEQYPYYSHSGVVLPLRLLFVGFACLALFFSGVAAFQLARNPHALWIAPLLLSGAPLFNLSSWEYANVDVLASMFVMASASYLLFAWEKDTVLHKAVIPGILCGLTAASKYTHGLIIFPFLLAILLGKSRPRWRLIFTLCAVAGVAFVVAMPFSLLDLRRFVHTILGLRQDYAGGWPGHTVEPGWTHAKLQLGRLVDNFGWTGFMASLFGFAWAVKAQSRKGWCAVAYPVGFFLYFSAQATSFSRNLLPVYSLFASFAAVGAVSLFESLKGAISRRWTAKISTAWAFTGVTGVFLLFPPPLASSYNRYWGPVESRNEVLLWIERHIPEGSEIIFASELGINLRPLSGRYRAREAAFTPEPVSAQRPWGSAGKNAYYVVPRFGGDVRRREGPWSAACLNRLYAGGKELISFGANDSLTNYSTPSPWGNPALTVRAGLSEDPPEIQDCPQRGG